MLRLSKPKNAIKKINYINYTNLNRRINKT